MAPANNAASVDDLLQHSGWVVALARRLVRDAATADDLVQETWIQALRRPPRSGQPLRPWLGTVLRNLARQRYRSSERRSDREQRAAAPEAVLASPDEVAASTESLRILGEELERLPEPFRRTLLQHHLKELSAVSIARAEGTSEGTVRWRLVRGRELLREALDRRYGGDRRAWLAALGALLPADAVRRAGLTTVALLLGVGATAIGVAALLDRPAVGDPDRGADTALTIDGGAAARASAIVPAETAPEAASERRPVVVDQAASGRGSAAAGDLSVAPDRVRLIGRVVDRQGRSLDRAELEWLDARDVFGYCDEDGHFDLSFRPHQAGQRLHLRFSKGRYCDFVHESIAELGRVVDLGSVVLVGERSIVGRVVDSDGRPIAGATVVAAPAAVGPGDGRELTGPGSWPGLALEPVRTNSAGDFRALGWPNLPLRVWAAAPGSLYATSDEQPVGPVERRVVLALAPLPASSRIFGRVLNSDGLAVEGVAVRLVGRGGRGASGPGGAVVTTGADGRFELSVRGPGPFRLEAEDLEDRWRDAVLSGVRAGDRELELRLDVPRR